MKKKIAFLFAFPIRTNPMLITMPFGLNVITLLDRKGYEIDVFLSEYQNDSYENLFSDRVKVHFLDHNYLWPKEGLWSYVSLTTYFRFLAITRLRNTYSHIFASGMAGITLGGILKRTNKQSTFIYLNDEFPVQHTIDIWVKNEIKYAQRADVVVTPDESRFEPLAKQIKGLITKPHFTLPNAPLLEELEQIPEKDWHEYFGITKHKKMFLMAGGLQDFNCIEELLRSVSMWPRDTVLILKGKNDITGFQKRYKEYENEQRIIWSTENFKPEELHSLIKHCSASLCLYRPINDNLRFVGKSSGKLMRSVLLGKPVIATENSAFEFVDTLSIGILVSDEPSIAQAIKTILENESIINEACLNSLPELSFETYWKKLETYLGL